MALAAAFTITLLSWYAWYESGRKPYLAGFYFCLGLGMLAKGPVAPLLAGLIIVVFAWRSRDIALLWRTLWLPGLLLFCVVALPWYIAVQLKTPEFFRIFILEHNLARFGTDLYHHQQPFWYYVPVTFLGLLPWTVIVVAAVLKTIRGWTPAGKSQAEAQWNAFLVIWLLVPLLFFSFSQSKLPGYIVPAVPAGTLLVAEYIRRHIIDGYPATPWLIVLHALVAVLPIIPALMIQYILQHRLPWGKATMLACGVALIFAAGIAITLVSRLGLRMLRFVTLVPVVLVVAWILRVGGPSLDAALSARPVATDVASMETKPLPMAVFGVSRETEYGLTFYRNQVISRYELGQIPVVEHLLVAVEGSQPQIVKLIGDRRVSHLGNFTTQHLEYFWISGPGIGRGR
jgi:4-amino-4-deoxy-L-arabinose transferase-like glycosyltransferase